MLPGILVGEKGIRQYEIIITAQASLQLLRDGLFMCSLFKISYSLPDERHASTKFFIFRPSWKHSHGLTQLVSADSARKQVTTSHCRPLHIIGKSSAPPTYLSVRHRQRIDDTLSFYLWGSEGCTYKQWQTIQCQVLVGNASDLGYESTIHLHVPPEGGLTDRTFQQNHTGIKMALYCRPSTGLGPILDALMYAYNTQAHTSTGYTLFELVLSRLPQHLAMENYTPPTANPKEAK